MDFTTYFSDFCKQNELSINLSLDMPKGYENAYGTFDIVKNTLFINQVLAENSPDYEVLFYLFHELRHALQYNKPHLFDEKIRRSLNYVVLYNGTCYKLVDNEWKKCILEGKEDYFTEVYLSLPYEIDAGEFACRKTKSLFGKIKEIDKLYSFWKPKKQIGFCEIEKLFDLIDKTIQ